MNNPNRLIINRLKTLRTRMRVQTIYQKSSLTLCIGISILALLFIGIRFISFPFSATIITLLVLLVSFILGVCLGFRNRITLSNIASYVDNHLKLKARLITALELIHTDRQGELTQLQINDTADNIANKDIAKVIPHTFPSILKWIPIPLIVIGLSFAIPHQYAIPLPPTIAEKEAIDNTIEALTNELNKSAVVNLHERIKETIAELEDVKDVTTAHEQLQVLNDVVRKQKSTLPDESTIASAAQATDHFKGMNTSALTDELDKLAGQDLTPELRAEIQKLLEKLAENVPQGEFSQTIEKLQGKTVTQDTLKDIVQALNQLEQLNALEAQITESRKNIALASIETKQPDGNIASSDSEPGQETGNEETQGAQVNPNDSEFSPVNDDTTPPTVDNATNDPLTGDDTPTLQTDGKEISINSDVASDTESITRVYTGNIGNMGDEPEYMPFADVVLNAEREYAQAIENKRIPLQYRSQIKIYLEALARINDK